MAELGQVPECLVASQHSPPPHLLSAHGSRALGLGTNLAPTRCRGEEEGLSAAVCQAPLAVACVQST